MSESTFEAGTFDNAKFKDVNLSMTQFKVRRERCWDKFDDQYYEKENFVDFCNSTFNDVKIAGANFEGARFTNCRMSVRLDDMGELPGTLSAIKTIHFHYRGRPTKHNLELDVVMQAKALIASIESAKQLSETLVHLKIIDDTAIKRELMEGVVHRFNVLHVNRSKVESPELIAQTEELRRQILSEVSGQAIYKSSSEIQDFITMAVLQQTIFGYSQGYLIEGR